MAPSDLRHGLGIAEYESYIRPYHRLQVICRAEKLAQCFDVVLDLPRKITQFALEVSMNGYAEPLLLCYRKFMFGDDTKSGPSVGENILGMIKLSSGTDSV